MLFIAGEWEGGMRHGKGTLLKSTGEKYEGQWRWNAPYGLGTVTYKVREFNHNRPCANVSFPFLLGRKTSRETMDRR